MRHARILLVALAFAATGCASAGRGDATLMGRRQQNLLTQDEILATNYTTIYDVVAALRPAWLRTRGPISIDDPGAGQVIVYLNGVRAGGAEFLRQVTPREVTSLEYLNETEAGARFGLQQGGGAAIIVRTMRGG